MPAVIPQIIPFANELIAKALAPGDVAIDATVGNGNDTAFLARLVGNTGCVHGFDVQEKALQTTRTRLTELELHHHVQLHASGHEHMLDILGSAYKTRVRAVMFNLGYLPGNGKNIITTPQTTIPALENALKLLAPGGVASVMCYTGHEGGRSEHAQVREWCTKLDFSFVRVLRFGMLNKQDKFVELFFLEKQS